MKYALALSRLIAVVLLTSVLFAGCISRAVPVENAPAPWGDDEVPASDLIPFTIDNGLTQDVKVYSLRGNVPYRIGYVGALQMKQTVKLRKTDLDGAGCIRIMLKPLASSDIWVSDRVCMKAGQRLDLQVSPLLSASSLTPWDVRR